MSQFQQPVYPPPPPHGGAYHGGPLSGPAPWSGLAIAAFVLSLLGFLGFTALLGIILGIAGIFVTAGGKRRGMGLAIAALPISLAMGAISVLLVIGGLFLVRVGQFAHKIEPVFAARTDSMGESAAELHQLGSSAFKEAVSVDELEAWLKTVGEKNGALTSFRLDQARWLSPTPAGGIVLSVEGKFVNGPAGIRITISKESPLHPHMDDIEIGGSSPRKAEPD